jgi:hypothetical protein
VSAADASCTILRRAENEKTCRATKQASIAILSQIQRGCIHTTYIHTYIRTYIRTYVHTDKQTYKHTDIHTYIYTQESSNVFNARAGTAEMRTTRPYVSVKQVLTAEMWKSRPPVDQTQRYISTEPQKEDQYAHIHSRIELG